MLLPLLSFVVSAVILPICANQKRKTTSGSRQLKDLDKKTFDAPHNAKHSLVEKKFAANVTTSVPTGKTEIKKTLETMKLNEQNETKISNTKMNKESSEKHKTLEKNVTKPEAKKMKKTKVLETSTATTLGNPQPDKTQLNMKTNKSFGSPSPEEKKKEEEKVSKSNQNKTGKSQMSYKYQPPPVEQRPKKPENTNEVDHHDKNMRSLELIKDAPGFE